MTPNFDAYGELFKFLGALSVVAPLMSWWRKDTDAESDMEIAAANTVLEALSDADSVSKIDCLTQKNLRDQLTIEQVEEIHERREHHRWGWRRN